MKRFGGDRIKGIMEWAGFDENTPIENKMISRSIENAQTKVEGYHFDIRKHIVEYDDVINKQREVIYGERHKIIGEADLKANILSLISDEIKSSVAYYLKEEVDKQAAESLLSHIVTIFPLPPEINAQALSQMEAQEVEERLIQYSMDLYEKREAEMEPDNMRILERLVMLRTIDSLWVEHLTAMDYMRQGIGLQAMAQRDPLVAYKRKSHEMFQELMSTIQHDVVHTIFRVGIKRGAAPPHPAPSPAVAITPTGDSQKAAKTSGKRVGRNDPCPCGSGKKFKKCCGK